MGGKSKKTVEKICQNPLCGDPFMITPYDDSRGGGVYCSLPCVSIGKKLKLPTKEQLQVDYEAGLSTVDLAEKYNYSKGTIYNLFKVYGIIPRDAREAQINMHKTPKGQKVSQQRLETMVSRHGTAAVTTYKHFKSGQREDLPKGVSPRSGWEANVLRLLNYLNIKWEYEPEVFWFRPIKRGTRSYTPDIRLEDGTWIEVKGYLPPEGKTKIKRFKKYYPEEFKTLQAIVKNERCEAAEFFNEMGVPIWGYYDDLRKQYKSIVPHWEGL